MADSKKQDQVIGSQKRWWGGIGNYIKEDVKHSFYFAQSIDYRTDPFAVTLLPRTDKESGNTVTDLIRWGDTVPHDLSVYFYGYHGDFYKRQTNQSWTKLTQVPSSHGNGLQYFYGDDYIYYTGDSTLGRYGPMAGTPQFSHDFLTSQGGIPTNTAWIDFESSSSQSADAADSATLSITSDLTLEAFIKPESLPAVGSSMTLIGKWNESGALRSYKMDILGISGYFGDGGSGSLTISSDTTQSPIDSAATGTAGLPTVSATNVSFAAGQVVLIHQTKGTNPGQWERATIQSYTAGTITLTTNLVNTYTTGAQVIVIPQYTNVTVNSGVTWLAKAWNGTVGGILVFLANGTLTVTGTISATGRGFRGGTGGKYSSGVEASEAGFPGEGFAGTAGTRSQTANGIAGGGSFQDDISGGSGGHVTAGEGDAVGNGGNPGSIGSDTTDLTTMQFGGAGGGGLASASSSASAGGTGGNSGGIVFITAADITVNSTTGSIQANGQDGVNGSGTNHVSGGGGGAAGAILIKAQTANLASTTRVTATGGIGGTATVAPGGVENGFDGADGRIHLDYLTSYTATTSPTIDVTQDNTLVTSASYQARLSVSDDGTAVENLAKVIPNFAAGSSNRLSISWDASASLATFYLNGEPFGTVTGSKTAIHNNTSLLYIATHFGAAALGNYYDGKMDDVRIWNLVRSDEEILANVYTQLTGSEGGLVAYYKFNSAATDGTSNANNLTLRNSPTYATDVPYPAATTRLDIDQSASGGSNNYTLPTAISEASSDTLTYAPTLDPQKSFAVEVNAKGTGDWTLTVHDQQNNIIATKTIANASLPSSGYVEFQFTTPWRLVIGKTYHVHVTSTVNDGSVKVTTSSNFSTANYRGYFSFLVTDTLFHPIARMLNKIIIGNQRYLATWDGAFYNANFIAFPPNTHVRCFGFWREYLAIGTWQEKSSGEPQIFDFSSGRIYFWDGISLTFNFWIDVPEGQVNALLGQNNTLWFMAGSKGELFVYQGGYVYASGNANSQKVKRWPFLERDSETEIYPQAMAFWRGLLHIGMAANSTSDTLPKGVYSYGTLHPEYPESLSFDYPISTGNTGSTVRIGCVYPAGQALLISWQDGGAYGVDEVNFEFNAPAAFGTIQTFIQDGEDIWKQQLLEKIRADHIALRTGESITTKYKIDRETTWHDETSITDSATEQFTTSTVPNGRGQEFQLAVDLRATGETSPTLLGLSWLVNQLPTEQQF